MDQFEEMSKAKQVVHAEKSGKGSLHIIGNANKEACELCEVQADNGEGEGEISPFGD